MMVSRRLFLLGAAATVAAPALAKAHGIIGPVSRGVLDSRLGDRWIEDILFSSMPTGDEIGSKEFREEPVRFTLYRGEEAVFHMMINPRANFRWVATPGSEIFLPRNQLLRVDVEPNYTHTALNLISDIECPDFDPRNPRRPRRFSELFHWKDGEVTLSSVAALDLRDAKVLQGSAI